MKEIIERERGELELSEWEVTRYLKVAFSKHRNFYVGDGKSLFITE